MTVSATLGGVFLKGTAGSRPAANAVAGGTVYSATDTGVITQSDGSSWSTWATISAGMADPMTTRGDVIIRNASNVTARLGIGATGKGLKSDGTDIAWGYPSFRGAVAAPSGNTTLTTGGTEYPVAFGAADTIDTDGFHDPASANSRMTIPAAPGNGRYRVMGGCYIPAGAGFYSDLKIRKNGAAGTVLGQVRFTEAAGGNPIGQVVTPPVDLVATDYVELYASSSASATSAQGAVLAIEFLGV